ncbi:MAG TPA: argininosuccinate lyase [Acidimicrobiales bacterium]
MTEPEGPVPKPDPYAELADLAPEGPLGPGEPVEQPSGSSGSGGAPDPGSAGEPGTVGAGAGAGGPGDAGDGGGSGPGGAGGSASGDEAHTLWHGRFAGGPADELMAFTVSLPFDRRLALDDLAGSRAHVAGLARAEVITDLEATEILVALDQVEQELAKGDFRFVPSDEDIHTAIERRVTELAGDAGAKLHTGRSRNDQVATALRLWCKRELAVVVDRVVALQQVLLERAKAAEGLYLPGYTHLQRAQPVLLAHHLLAHGWALARDVDRLRDCIRRLDVSPLGAGALAGSSLPLDPAFTATELGFAKPFDNSLDAVSDRDFVAEALFALGLLAVHLSRMGEEIVLWTSEEFGFATLDDAYATGSSMLPQKKNADIAELARGKAGRVIGNLTGFLATLKGLPLAYNRDLQEDKEPLFDTVDQLRLALGAMAGLYRTITFEPKAMAAAGDEPSLSATDLAEWLVQQGMPFRKAHAVVGELVRRSLDLGQTLEDLVALHPDLGPEAARLVGPGLAVRRRTTRGAAGPSAVAPQLEAFEAHLAAVTSPDGDAEAEGEGGGGGEAVAPVETGATTGVVAGDEAAPAAPAADAVGAPEVDAAAEAAEPAAPAEPVEERRPGELPQIEPLVPPYDVRRSGELPQIEPLVPPVDDRRPSGELPQIDPLVPPVEAEPAPAGPPAPEVVAGPDAPVAPVDASGPADAVEPVDEPGPGEPPAVGPLVSAFTAAATSALEDAPAVPPDQEPPAPPVPPESEQPEKPEKAESRKAGKAKPEKPVSGEFDLSEFGQFVASFDLDKSSEDDGKAEP